MSLKKAIELPNLIARGDTFSGEMARFPPAVLAGLRERGIELKGGHAENSGLHGVVRRADGTYEGRGRLASRGRGARPAAAAEGAEARRRGLTLTPRGRRPPGDAYPRVRAVQCVPAALGNPRSSAPAQRVHWVRTVSG